MRTTRSIIKVRDLILPYIKFTSPTFIGLLERFKSIELNPESLKGSFKYSVNYKDVKTDFVITKPLDRRRIASPRHNMSISRE